jgi:hypothetical protein
MRRCLCLSSPNKRISLAIFMRETATVFNAPWHSTRASWVANASNFNQILSQIQLKVFIDWEREREREYVYVCEFWYYWSSQQIKCKNLVWSSDKGKICEFSDFSGNFLSKTLVRIESLRNERRYYKLREILRNALLVFVWRDEMHTVPTAVPPWAK